MRVDDPTARDYYIRECAEQGWTTRELERAIDVCGTLVVGVPHSAPAWPKTKTRGSPVNATFVGLITRPRLRLILGPQIPLVPVHSGGPHKSS